MASRSAGASLPSGRAAIASTSAQMASRAATRSARAVSCRCAKRVKNVSHAVRKRCQMASDRDFFTGPIVFHSACNWRISPAVLSQSELGASASAFSQSASFRARFSFQLVLRSERSW